MTDLIHGFRVTADGLEDFSVREGDLDDGWDTLPGGRDLEPHSFTMMGEFVCVLSERGTKPLNVAIHLAADCFIPPIRGTAYVFGLDLEQESGFRCVGENAARFLKRSASLASHPRSLEVIRDRARTAGLEACDVMEAVDELMERSR